MSAASTAGTPVFDAARTPPLRAAAGLRWMALLIAGGLALLGGVALLFVLLRKRSWPTRLLVVRAVVAVLHALFTAGAVLIYMMVQW